MIDSGRARLIYLENVVNQVQVANVAVNKTIVGHVCDIDKVI